MDNYYGLTHFIVPPVAKEVKQVQTFSKEAPKQEKAVESKKTIRHIKDEVKGYDMDKRGYKPKGLVIHNDAGGMNYKQYRDNPVSYTHLRAHET